MTNALELAQSHLDKAGLLDESGAVLFSGASTLVEGPVYLLGLNPGGSDGPTLRTSIANSFAEHNCYLDEQWAPGGRLMPKGQSTLQRRVQHLCATLKLETREVPASNLVFTRSTRVSHHPNFKDTAELCLVDHHIFLDAIKPDLIVTYGSLANFNGLAESVKVESRSAEHAAWMAYRGTARIGNRTVKLANIPHMSLWASDKRQQVLDWALA